MPDWQPIPLVGDVNCDLVVTAEDVLLDLKVIAGLPVSTPCVNAGNVTCLDELTADDIPPLLRYLAGLPPELPGDCRAIAT